MRVLVDDMIDTAGTITEAINVLTNAGAKKVIVVATHGILSDPASKRPPSPRAAEVVVTDTLLIPAEKRAEQLTVSVYRAARLARFTRSSKTVRSHRCLTDGFPLTSARREVPCLGCSGEGGIRIRRYRQGLT